MSDFQKFLDEALTKIEVLNNQEQENYYDYDIYREIALMIAEEREQLGLSQAELARRAGLTLSTVRKIENSGVAPSLGTLKKIADAMGKRLIVSIEEKEEG